jgi:accessory gene regulator B
MISIKRLCCDAMIGVIKSHHTLDVLTYKRVVYGVEMLYLAFSKFVFIGILALMLGNFHGFCFALISFNWLKAAAFGLHGKSSIQCLAVSCVGLLLLPLSWIWLTKYYSVVHSAVVNSAVVYSIAFVMPLYFYHFAPSDTLKRPLVGARTRIILKKKVLYRCILLSLLVIIMPSFYLKVFILCGMLTQAYCNCPLVYTLMKENRRNYEKFEGRT